MVSFHTILKKVNLITENLRFTLQLGGVRKHKKVII